MYGRLATPWRTESQLIWAKICPESVYTKRICILRRWTQVKTRLHYYCHYYYIIILLFYYYYYYYYSAVQIDQLQFWWLWKYKPCGRKLRVCIIEYPRRWVKGSYTQRWLCIAWLWIMHCFNVWLCIYECRSRVADNRWAQVLPWANHGRQWDRLAWHLPSRRSWCCGSWLRRRTASLLWPMRRWLYSWWLCVCYGFLLSPAITSYHPSFHDLFHSSFLP